MYNLRKFRHYIMMDVFRERYGEAAHMAITINDFAFDYEQFNFAHLRVVLPIAQTVSLGDLSLTVTSLECYEAGFAANLLFEQPSSRPSQPEPPPKMAPEPPLILSAMPAITTRDDRGTHYAGRLRAGHGGGGPSVDQLRDVYNFAPALDPAAASLTLQVLFVTRLGWNQAGEPQWTNDDIVTGPWDATFTLLERS